MTPPAAPPVGVSPPVLAWLLDQDPALRWQVERDLAGEPPGVWEATRARVATEGMGARLLAERDPATGMWAGGAFFPADFSHEAEPDGQPWTATTWVLNDLREWGVDAAALPGEGELLAEHARWEYDDLPYWGGEVDVCINAWTLMNGAWLGVDMATLADWFVEHRLDDGGWNCEWVEGATVSSVASTLNALTGLLDYEHRTGRDPRLDEARRTGAEYLLERRLLFRRRNGELISENLVKPGYPFRHVYSALRALDHFRAAAEFDGNGPDPRLTDAIEVVRGARQPDGRWLQQRRLPGRVWFEFDAPVGEPSPWLTFVAARVLAWWDGERPA